MRRCQDRNGTRRQLCSRPCSTSMRCRRLCRGCTRYRCSECMKCQSSACTRCRMNKLHRSYNLYLRNPHHCDKCTTRRRCLSLRTPTRAISSGHWILGDLNLSCPAGG